MPIFKRTSAQELDLLEQHLTIEIISQTDCNTILTKLKTTFVNDFHSEFKERMQKYTRFDAQSFKDAMIFVIQNTCSEKEDTNSETASSKSVKESSLDSATKDVHAIKYKMSKAKERCMAYFRSLHSHLQFTLDYDSQMTDKYFLEYTGIEVKHFRDTLLQHMGNVKKSVTERTRHQRQYDRRVNKRRMQTQESKVDEGKALDVDLVDTESIRTNSIVQDESSRLGHDTDVDDEYIRPIYNEEPMAEVQLTAECNIFAIGQQHTEQPKIINKGVCVVSKSSCITITAVPKADHSKNSSSFSDSKHFVCSTCHKCVFSANHDACIKKLLKEVNLRAKIQSHKTRNSNKPVDQKSHTQKPGRQIFKGHRFFSNKTSDVYEKTSPRSDLRWKPTSRIFKFVGLRWIPTGKLFDSCKSKVDSEPPHGSNVDIPNIHECKQTLDVSAGTSINVQKEQSLDLSAELKSLFGPLFDEYFNGENQVVSKSSAVTTADASDKRQQQPDSTSSTSTLATSVTADGNFDL
ncbi:hypothetical protein Tco_0418518 [Tanacetum coccineum]